MFKPMRKSLSAVLLLQSLTIVHAQSSAQPVGPSPRQAALGPSLRNFLRQPDGLQKLSEKVGDVYLTESEEAWGEHTLSSLTSSSDLVVIATIGGYTSRLIQDGDSIESEYNFQPVQTLKGSLPAQLSFTAAGGAVTLSNGHVAALHTPVSDGLRTGEAYVLFLRNRGSALVLVGGSQSLLHLNPSSGKAELLGTSRNSTLAADLDKRSIAEVKSEILSSNSSR
jgi:hypothetical protein